jgi:di/tricarboxylate transporter
MMLSGVAGGELIMEALFTGVSWKAVATLAILAGAIYGFVSERVRPDITAFLALLALLLTGILTPVEAFSGFSHPATVSVAAVLVLSAGVERSGALEFVARRVLAPFGRSEVLFTIVVMVVIAAISAFVNNTAAVAIFIPTVVQACGRAGLSPGRILMPMSHAATFGGMCTLIGTSTNLVAHEYALTQQVQGFSMFELAKVGLPMLAAGFAYILLVGRWFLPREEAPKSDVLVPSGPYVAELIISHDSLWIGREARPDLFERDFDLKLIEMMRAGQSINLERQSTRYAAHDSLLVLGPLQRILSLAAREGLDVHRPADQPIKAASVSDGLSPVEETSRRAVNGVRSVKEHKHLPLAEVVVLSTSGLIGRTLKSARFSEQYDTVVVGLRRRGGVSGRPSTTPLHAGDVIAVEGEQDAIAALSETPGFLVIGTPPRPQEHTGRTLIVFLTVGGVVTAVSLGILPIVTAATAGCAVLMLTGCLKPREAYRAIDLSIVFLLAGSLALGAALEKTSVTHIMASALNGLSGSASPFVLLACFFLVAVIVSEFMSNSGTVPLLAPLALSVAADLGVNPRALLVAITFGSSAAFAMPIGYQTSLMIYGPGGYRFKDFIRMGIPLDLILAIMALWLIPIFWPL